MFTPGSAKLIRFSAELIMFTPGSAKLIRFTQYTEHISGQI